MSVDLRTQLCDKPDNYINDPIVEIQWAEKAGRRAEVHTNILLSSNTKAVKLCSQQEEIYKRFRQDFPTLDITVENLKGDLLSTWRTFCMDFQEVRDFNFGSLLRLRADQSYSDENTVVVPQIIFFAIEIARNLEGINEECKSQIGLHRARAIQMEENAI